MKLGGNPARIIKYRDLDLYEKIVSGQVTSELEPKIIKKDGFKKYLS